MSDKLFFFFFSFLLFLWLSLNEIEEKKSVFLIFVVRVLVVVECDAVRCCNLGSSSGKRRREEKRGKKTSDRAVVYIKKGRPLSRPLCVCWCVCVCVLGELFSSLPRNEAHTRAKGRDALTDSF